MEELVIKEIWKRIGEELHKVKTSNDFIKFKSIYGFLFQEKKNG